MSWRKEDRRAERGYHHGNLKEALLQAALNLIAQKGAAGFTFADAARRKLPMSPEDLLEAEVLIYLRGLGFPTDRRPSSANDKPDEAPAGASGPSSGPWGKPK